MNDPSEDPLRDRAAPAKKSSSVHYPFSDYNIPLCAQKYVQNLLMNGHSHQNKPQETTSLFLFFSFLFEQHHPLQSRVISNSQSSCLDLQSGGTGAYHHVQLVFWEAIPPFCSGWSTSPRLKSSSRLNLLTQTVGSSHCTRLKHGIQSHRTNTRAH